MNEQLLVISEPSHWLMSMSLTLSKVSLSESLIHLLMLILPTDPTTTQWLPISKDYVLDSPLPHGNGLHTRLHTQGKTVGQRKDCFIADETPPLWGSDSFNWSICLSTYFITLSPFQCSSLYNLFFYFVMLPLAKIGISQVHPGVEFKDRATFDNFQKSYWNLDTVTFALDSKWIVSSSDDMMV